MGKPMGKRAIGRKDYGKKDVKELRDVKDSKKCREFRGFDVEAAPVW
jgi:hypothetical protein